jgi:hypothetical protein
MKNFESVKREIKTINSFAQMPTILLCLLMQKALEEYSKDNSEESLAKVYTIAELLTINRHIKVDGAEKMEKEFEKHIQAIELIEAAKTAEKQPVN